MKLRGGPRGGSIDIKQELLFDFAVNIPRVLVAGNTTVLDNVKRLMMLTDTQIVVSNGRRYTSVKGRDFVVSQLKEERMLVKGEVEEIRFFTALQEDKG